MVDLSVNLNTDGNYTTYSYVWIDWNQDSDFEDAGEEYDLGSATNTPNGAIYILCINPLESNTSLALVNIKNSTPLV